MKDALSNEIIIGNSYGVARNKCGQNTIKIGVVTKITPFGFALLKIDKEYISDGFDQPELTKGFYKSVKVKPFMLFPVNK